MIWKVVNVDELLWQCVFRGVERHVAQPRWSLQGIHLGARIKLQTRARADPFQPFRSFVERLRANCRK
ncbi:hypothetical protein Y032_0011g1347 [Ancylostoma ceylanicum]|uniref:Uncharacterized protein n=1 Tax=Ancylostoma ceylanicum TaxID=53326 RepID=A0A016VDI2_9BILA|nr:hypothetical protein Y032_0011g1347 [Ancylostoma ceylanicum]